MKILEGKNITKSYDGKKIIEDISLYVNKGEMVSLLGVSGIGKTTLFNIMSGLEAPDSGEVFCREECVTGKRGITGYMQQSDLLLPFKTIVKNVMIPLVLKGVDKKEAQKRAEEILEEFSLSEYKDMYPHKLSGGMRQRVALARTFLMGSDIMLLDEPFSALDALTRRDMQNWFKEKVRKHSIATLFITHDIDEAILMSDRIYILKGDVGRISDEIAVDISHKDTMSGDFIEIKKEILEKVR